MVALREKLINTLWRAEEIASEFEGGYSERFIDAKDFHKALKASIIRFEKGDDTVLDEIFLWFLPTSDFDDFVGFAGMDVANEVCELINQYKPDILDQ